MLLNYVLRKVFTYLIYTIYKLLLKCARLLLCPWSMLKDDKCSWWNTVCRGHSVVIAQRILDLSSFFPFLNIFFGRPDSSSINWGSILHRLLFGFSCRWRLITPGLDDMSHETFPSLALFSLGLLVRGDRKLVVELMHAGERSCGSSSTKITRRWWEVVYLFAALILALYR